MSDAEYVRWQQERDAKSLANLRMGAWAAMCCHLDLYEITDEEELEHIREQLTDPTVTREGWMVWATRREALEEMRSGYDDDPPSDAVREIVAEIDAMLAEETR
jgi:hypothetical protein